jgi:hypothetical protein
MMSSLFFDCTRVWSQGFALGRQALQYLSHVLSPSCFSYFSGRVLCFFSWDQSQTLYLAKMSSFNRQRDQ